MENIESLIAMIFSEILLIFLAFFIKRQKKSQTKYAFVAVLSFMFIWTTALILQLSFQSFPIEPIFFEKIAIFGACTLPVAFMVLGIVYARTKINFKWYYCLFAIIPIISIVLMLTNDVHHLFIQQYSLKYNSTVYGPYFIIHSIYSYACIGIGLLYFIVYSIRNSGFFSKQSILVIIGTILPLTVNIVATFSSLNLSVYVTPISYSFTVLCFALAIFKFKFLSITPIALQRIVDRISDSYIVLDEENTVIDFNETFIRTFNLEANKIRNFNLFDLLNKFKNFKLNLTILKSAIEKADNSSETVHLTKKFDVINRYFNIEINSITSKGNYLGTLILFKDITQHMNDMKTIQRNQDLLIEKERLASLGQMIGGIAHNLKTPIMSISGALEGLTDLITEYNNSIGDPEVSNQDHHEIASDMSNWIDKIKTHLSYMSDIITAVKGQAINFAGTQISDFTLEELMKQVTILMKHELNNALINLNISMNVGSDLTLYGNINSLVQVINNMISNSIQAYNGEKNKDIDLCISKKDSNIIISITDYGMGMSKEVQDKLFKEMITTKGKNGTGLGLFMSHSNIRAHFNGNITFKSTEGKGTTFNIILPL